MGVNRIGKESTPGKWSGPQAAAIDKLHAMVPGEGGVSIQRMWFDADSQGVDYQFMRFVSDQMQALESALPYGDTEIDPKTFAQQAQVAFTAVRELLAEHQPVAQSYVFSAGAEGAEVVDGDGIVQFATDRISY